MVAVFAHAQSSESVLEVTHTQNTKTVPLHDVFEITFQHDQEYEAWSGERCDWDD